MPSSSGTTALGTEIRATTLRQTWLTPLSWQMAVLVSTYSLPAFACSAIAVAKRVNGPCVQAAASLMSFLHPLSSY